jgi:hypothetical protein
VTPGTLPDNVAGGGGQAGGGGTGGGVGGGAGGGTTTTTTGQNPVQDLVTGLGLDQTTNQVFNTVGQVSTGLTTLLQSTQSLDQLVPSTLGTVNQALGAVGQTVNGLLVGPNGQAVPPAP